VTREQDNMSHTHLHQFCELWRDFARVETPQVRMLPCHLSPIFALNFAFSFVVSLCFCGKQLIHVRKFGQLLIHLHPPWGPNGASLLLTPKSLFLSRLTLVQFRALRATCVCRLARVQADLPRSRDSQAEPQLRRAGLRHV
jgi:hypothetical protein